ncbi:MAG: hypothetical protein ACI4WS_05080 [Oscillospiraceae bacterium]
MISLKAYRKPNNILFAEMILALLFFVISFTVIIRVFASADNLGREDRRREKAVLIAQSAAEAYSVSGDPAWALEQALGYGVSFTDGKCEFTVDDSFAPSDSGEITLTFEEQRSEPVIAGSYSELSMTFTRGGEEFYSLDCAAYIPEKWGVPVLD